MYNIHSYGEMLADTPRMDAYVAALRLTVKPDSVVLDLGSGPGLFALLACKLGARRVYAIEPDDVIQLGRQAAQVNGFGDRIEFFQDFSTNIKLPEPADIIVSDLRGVLPWFQQHIPSIRDARTRLLAPGGVLIPQRDYLWAAVVEVPERHSELLAPWTTNALDFDMSAAIRVVTNTWRKARIKSEELLVEPIRWAVLDYSQVEEPDIRGEISWLANRSGTAHGVSVWFDSELADGISFSNQPGSQELIYGSAFFPFPAPVEIESGDRIDLTITADLIVNDYVWRWNTKVFAPEGNPTPKASFKQSTLFGTPISVARLHKQATTYVPIPNEEGQIEAFVLSKMDGKNSIEQIAMTLLDRFPFRFSEANDAVNLVAEVSAKYSQ